MFLGTTTKPIRAYLSTALQDGGFRRIWEPFAGNFAFTQVMMESGRGVPCFSGDVSLYSVMVGKGLSDQVESIKPSPFLNSLFEYKDDWTPIEKASYVIMASDISKFVGKMEKIEYARRFVGNYSQHQREIMEGLTNRLLKIKAKIKNWNFRAIDAFELMKDVEPGDMVFYDPPYFDGGYERMYRFLRDNIEWKEPQYTNIDEAKKIEGLEMLLERGANVFFRSYEPIEYPDMRKVFEFEHKPGAKYVIYTNHERTRTFAGSGVKFAEEQKKIDLVTPDLKLTGKEKVEVVEIKKNVANHYRLLWTKKAKVKDASEVSYGVFLDRKLVGVIGILGGRNFSAVLACIVSDAVPLYTAYKRLSKLVLYLILTEEMLTVINRRILWYHEGFSTVAYTDEPASMKYRGLFEMSKREAGVEHQFKITYQTRKTVAPTFKEAYKMWWEQHGRYTRVG